MSMNIYSGFKENTTNIISEPPPARLSHCFFPDKNHFDGYPTIKKSPSAHRVQRNCIFCRNRSAAVEQAYQPAGQYDQ